MTGGWRSRGRTVAMVLVVCAFAGFMFDTFGGYQAAFTILLALFAVALPAILAVRRPKEMAPSPGFTD